MESLLRGLQRECFQSSLTVKIVTKDKLYECGYADYAVGSKGWFNIRATEIFSQDRAIPKDKVNLIREQEAFALTDRYLQAIE
jgi:hypothetical protein